MSHELAEWGSRFLSIDAPALTAALLASILCAMVGNWLVLRRESLMGDAISHAVLPGIVVAFLVSGTRAPLPMLLGAAVAGLLTALASVLVRRLARIDSGAAMGVVFTAFFAAGILLMERASARQVDLDPECVLYGSLESLFWFPPQGSAFWSLETLRLVPTPIWTLLGTAVVAAVVLRLLRKELAIASFDPGLAAALGLRPGLVHAILMTLTAAAAVASFEAVGSILVVALFVAPPAAARLWTDRLLEQGRLSVLFAIGAALVGYALAALAPRWLGTTSALNAAGSIALVAGAWLGLSVLVSPRHGALAAWRRRRHIARRVAREDLLASLHRLGEALESNAAPAGPSPVDGLGRSALREAIARGEVVDAPDGVRLTELGRETARGVVRRHRLWESYLVDEAGLAPDHVHEPAERLEHVRGIAPAPRRLDPHGKEIP